tara:strand:- start:2 stop:601 length:600 start_codon:yes stop_codon:yes gene_type:complete
MKAKNYEHQTEKQLLAKCRRGDTCAFDEIILRNGEYIYSWILSKEKDRHLADDLFQRTLVKSWRAIKKFKGDSTYSTWANAIARNLVIDDYNKKQRNKEDNLEDISEHKRPSVEVDGGLSPLESVARKEKESTMKDALSRLSVPHKEILQLYYMNQLTYKEISRTIDCSIGTVMSRLFYAKKSVLKLINSDKNLKKILL